MSSSHIFFCLRKTECIDAVKLQYAAFTLRQQFLHIFSVKSSSNLKPNNSFGICSSWGFRNTPYMLNLMKFWLRYLRLKTVDIFQKNISSSSFSLSIISVNSSANSKIRNRFEICVSCGFQNCHWLLKSMKTWLRYARLKARLNFCRMNKSCDEIKFWSGINCIVLIIK